MPLRLADVVPAWSDEMLEEFYAYRYSWMTAGPGNIVSPAPPRVQKYYPFEDNDYEWRTKLGNTSNEEWSRLMRMDPKDLLCGNPFAPSLARKGGYRVWDSAVAVPACHLRGDRIRRYDDVPAMRRCNRYWVDTALPAIKHVGPIGFNREVLRPMGPNIFDLTTMDDGWTILEAAHALTHLRGDFKPPIRRWATDKTVLNGRFHSTVADIIVAKRYGIPLDVSDRMHNDPAAPDCQYGLELKSSATFMDPVLKLPVKNREAGLPDRTLAVMVTGVHIEPHPHGYETKTDLVGPQDHWCCMPTIVVLAGWECIDVITHQAIGQDHYKSNVNEDAPPVYVMRPADLMPPDLLWGYLVSGYKHLGPPVTNERWQYFDEWIQTDAYKDLIKRTPPLVCPECMTFVKTEKAPRHPKWDHDPKKQKEDPEEPIRKEERRRVHAIVTEAIKKYERRNVYGDGKATDVERSRRKSNHMEELVKHKDVREYIKVVRKKKNCGRVRTTRSGQDVVIGALTRPQQDRYNLFRKNHSPALVADIEAHALRMGWLNL